MAFIYFWYTKTYFGWMDVKTKRKERYVTILTLHEFITSRATPVHLTV